MKIPQSEYLMDRFNAAIEMMEKILHLHLGKRFFSLYTGKNEKMRLVAVRIITKKINRSFIIMKNNTKMFEKKALDIFPGRKTDTDQKFADQMYKLMERHYRFCKSQNEVFKKQKQLEKEQLRMSELISKNVEISR